MRLQAAIGNDAFWVPPRLWAYCAENQPDGDLASYSDSELALLIGYRGDATSMLQALKDSGFLDFDGKVHDWSQHNGYHATYSERAKTAANARWGKKEKNQKKETEGTEKKGETSIATSMLDASPHSEFIKLWCDAYLLHWKSKYAFKGGKDGKAVKELLSSTGKTPSELVSVAVDVWNHDFRLDNFLASQSTTIAGFSSRINEIQAALHKIKNQTKKVNRAINLG